MVMLNNKKTKMKSPPPSEHHYQVNFKTEPSHGPGHRHYRNSINFDENMNDSFQETSKKMGTEPNLLLSDL